MDTLRALYSVGDVPTRRGRAELNGDTWAVDPHPSFGLVALEGNPTGGALWTPEDLLRVAESLDTFVDDHFGLVADKGVSRLDVTNSRLHDPARGRAYLAGMAALELPRLEATRRGSPVHSVWWTGAESATMKARVYCESFKVASREPFERVRSESQGRYPSGRRPLREAAFERDFQREQFSRRFNPMRKAVAGVKAASFPVIAQALADEARYGYRPVREVERLAGALVVLSGGGGEAYKRSTYYNRRAELREAGFVVVDDFMEPVEVDLEAELEATLEDFAA